ncbi:MAG: hypothetical protein U0802_08905 [Candidatus Binatia bacterium]
MRTVGGFLFSHVRPLQRSEMVPSPLFAKQVAAGTVGDTVGVGVRAVHRL